MSKLFFLIGALCVLQVAYGRVTRDAPVEPHNAISGLAKQAEDAISTLHVKFLEYWGVKTDDEFTNLVTSESQSYGEKLKGLLTELSAEAKTSSSKVSGLVQEVTDKISQRSKDFQTNNPDIVPGSKEFNEKFEAGLSNIATEFKQLGNTLSSQGETVGKDLENVVKRIVDTTVQTAKTVADKAEELKNKQ